MPQLLDLFVLSCVFLSAESQTGQISPPQNVTLLWLDDFKPELSWAPIEESCTYRVYSGCPDCDFVEVSDPSWNGFVVMNGGSLQFRVETICSKTHSDQAVVNISYPELVRDLQCYIRSSTQCHCSWLPASNSPDLSFFYRLVNEADPDEDDTTSYLQECSSYKKTGNRTGCDLQAHVGHAILILFNGTLNNTLIRNTFRKEFKDDVRPPPLKWKVTLDGNEFNIEWTPPDFIHLSQWTFYINYTMCDERKTITIDGKTSIKLHRNSRCSLSMSIAAHTRGGQTPWSDEKHFEADKSLNVSVYVAFIIPLMFAGLAALTFMCCRKNKETIFPKVPEPRDLLSDISHNNNKSTVHNLYMLAEEEDYCKISLVMDPQIEKVNS